MTVPRDHLQPSLGPVYDYIDNLEKRIAELEGGAVQGTPAELTTGTETEPRTWSPKVLHDYVDGVVNP